MSDFPWETDRDLFVEVMNHGRFFLNMQLFQDVRDRDQMKIAFDSLVEHGRVPEGWDRDYTDDGRPFYWHASWPEDKTVWEHPTNRAFAEKLHACHLDLAQRPPPLPMPLPPPEQQVPPLAVNDPRSRSLSLGGLSAGSSPNDHGNNRPRAGSVSSVDPRGNSAGSSSSSQGGLSPRPPHTGGPLPGGHALWPGLDGGGESVVEHLGEHSGSGSAVDDDNEEEEEAEEEVLHSDRSGSHGSRGSGLELPQDTSGAHGDMDAPLNEDSDDDDELPETLHAHVPPPARGGLLMEDSADAEESIGGDAEEEKSGVIEFEPIEASILSASDGGGGGDSDGNVVVEDDIESMSPLTGVPPAGPGDDAPSVVSAAMGGSIVGAPPLLTGLYGIGQRVECRFGGKSKYYPGEIVEVNGDGTYKIHYDDGDREISAREECIRAIDVLSGDEGEEEGLVDGPLVGPRLLDHAMNETDNDGSVDDSQALGDETSGYEEEESSVLSESPMSPTASARAGFKFYVGQSVEAQFTGTTRYYPGVVRKINGNGTYGIQYEDGDKERSVPEAMIREITPADSSTNKGQQESVSSAASAPNEPAAESSVPPTIVAPGENLIIATGHRAPSLATLESNDELVGGFAFPESGGSSALDDDDDENEDGVVPFSPQSSTDASMDVAAVKGFFGSGGFASTGGDGSVVDGSVAEGSVAEGSLARSSVHEGSMAGGSIARGSAPHVDPRSGEGATTSTDRSMGEGSVNREADAAAAAAADAVEINADDGNKRSAPEIPLSESAPTCVVGPAKSAVEATSSLHAQSAQETDPNTGFEQALEEPAALRQEGGGDDVKEEQVQDTEDAAAAIDEDEVEDLEEASFQTSEPSFDRSEDGSLSPEVPSHKNQEVLDPESTAPPTSAPAASEPEVPPAPQAFNGLSAYQRARAAMFMSDDSGLGDDSTEGMDANFHDDDDVHKLNREPLNVVGKPLSGVVNNDDDDDEFAQPFIRVVTSAVTSEAPTNPAVTSRSTDDASSLPVVQQPLVAAAAEERNEEVEDEGERNSFDADSVASADLRESSPTVNESSPVVQSNEGDKKSGSALINRVTAAADVNDDDSGSGSSIEMLADAVDGDAVDNDDNNSIDNTMTDHEKLNNQEESTTALVVGAPAAAQDISIVETPQSNGLYGVGQRVECRFGGKSKYYPGEIVEVNGDGTYRIHYDDGDRESSAREECIRPLEEEMPTQPVPTPQGNGNVGAANGAEAGMMEELDFEEDAGDNEAGNEVKMLKPEDVSEAGGDEDEVEDFEEASSAGQRSNVSDVTPNDMPHREDMSSATATAEVPRPRAVVISAARSVMSRPRSPENGTATTTTTAAAPVAPPLASSPHAGGGTAASSAPSSPVPAPVSLRNDGHRHEPAVHHNNSYPVTAEALAKATALGHAAGKAEASLEAEATTAEAVASAVAAAVEAAVKRERAAAAREAESLQGALSRAEAAAEADRVRLSRELDTQGQQVVALREQLSNLQAAGMGLDAAAALETANARLEARVQELNAAVVSARAETTAAAEASLERAIAAEATAAEALSNAKRSEVARKAAEAAAEAAETRAGEAEARVRVNVAMAAQAEEARKLAESEASEADAKMRALTAKEHVRNEDAIRATDAAVAACEERMKQEAASAQAITAAAHAEAIGDLQAQLLEGKEAISELRTTKSALKAAEAAAKTSSARLLEAHAVETRLRQALDGALLEADRLQTKVSELQQDLDGFPTTVESASASASSAGSKTTRGSLRHELATVRARCDELSASKIAQEAASAKELKELRGHNEALKRSCRDSEDAAARRVAESESQRAASDSAARHATAKAADATARAERAEATAARLSADLAAMEENLEQEARQRRTDQRRSEASVVGPLRDEVSALREEAEGLRVSLRATESRNKEASKTHAAEIAALQEEVRREVSALAESASSAARKEWEPRVAAAASQATLDAENKLKPSLAAAHHLSLELSDTAVSLKTQLESQAGELADALKERDSLAAKLEQVQAEVEALRDENMPLRQVALGISAADDAAASHALSAVEQSLSLLQGECRSLLMLGPPQDSSHRIHQHPHPNYASSLPARSFTAEPSIVELPSSRQEEQHPSTTTMAPPSQYPPAPPLSQPNTGAGASRSDYGNNHHHNNSYNNGSAYNNQSHSTTTKYNHENRAGVQALFASPQRSRRSSNIDNRPSAAAVDTSGELFLRGSLSRGAFAAASLDASDYEAGSSYVYGSGRANDTALGEWPLPHSSSAFSSSFAGKPAHSRNHNHGEEYHVNGVKAASAQHPLGSSIDAGDPFEPHSTNNFGSTRSGRENVPPPPAARSFTAPSPLAAPYGGATASLPYQPGVWKGRYA